MKRYKIEGSNIEDLIKKVAVKLQVKVSEVKYKIISEDKINKKFSLEVWVEDPAPLVVDKNTERITLELTKEGVFITINDEKITMNEVIDFIAEKDIQDPDIIEIDNAFYNKGKKYKIGDFKEGVYKEAEIIVETNDDLSEGYIIITEPKGVNLPSVETIKNVLIEKGIIFGIKDNLIKQALESKKYEIRHLVAIGEKPVNGKDGYSKFYVNVNQKKERLKPNVKEDGSVDFKSLDLIENVVVGQKLAEKILPEKGVNGKNIKGIEIVAKDGKEVYLPAGKNTTLSEDGMYMFAASEGMITFKDKKVNVLSVYVAVDVGVATGNINFIGSVLVKGDVMPDFKVEADGNIEVKGNVEKASLKSGADIVVRGGIFGKGTGKLESKGDIVLNFAESVIIEAEGNVIVNEAIMNSKVYSGKKVTVIDKKGVIVGGEFIASEGIEAINIGSPLAVKTDIEVGTNPHLIEEHKRIENEISELVKKLEPLEKNINLLQKMKFSMKDSMPKEKDALLMQLIKAKFSTNKLIAELKQKLEEIALMTQDVKKATVDVHGTCYPGIKIKIRKGTYFVKEKIHNVRFYYDESVADVKITALK